MHPTYIDDSASSDVLAESFHVAGGTSTTSTRLERVVLARSEAPSAGARYSAVGDDFLCTCKDFEALSTSTTWMIVEYPFYDDLDAECHVRHVLSSFDGISTEVAVNTEKRQRIAATFQRVCDASHAVSTLLRYFDSLMSRDGPDAARAVRIAFRAKPFHGRSGTGIDEADADRSDREHVTELLRYAGAHQALTTNETAAVAGPTLPAGVELVDTGIAPDNDGPDRIFELRVHDHERIDGTPSAASNLDWARRLARQQVPLTDDNLAALFDRWKTALDGSGIVALLTSPDGHAASAAAAELALRAHADGAVVLHGRWDPGTRPPYGAFREALGLYAAECNLARVRADLDRRAWDVTHLLPELGARLGSPSAPPGPQHDEDCRVGDALSDWFRAIAGRDDLLLVLDNAQWADPASLHLCEQLSNDLADHRVLVAVCGAEKELRSTGMFDVTTVLTAGADGDEHWIAVEPA